MVTTTQISTFHTTLAPSQPLLHRPAALHTFLTSLRTPPASTPQSCERTTSGRGRTPGRGRGSSHFVCIFSLIRCNALMRSVPSALVQSPAAPCRASEAVDAALCVADLGKVGLARAVEHRRRAAPGHNRHRTHSLGHRGSQGALVSTGAHSRGAAWGTGEFNLENVG